MAETNERIEAALAAHLDYLEMGGNEPDTSHLTAAEKQELGELLAALEMTSGIAFGLGRRDDSVAAAAPPEEQESGVHGLLVTELRAALGAEVRIETDTAPSVAEVGGIEIVGRWIVGTFG